MKTLTGSPETIIPGKSGFVVGNKKGIIEGILYFIENPDELKVFGEKNKDNVIRNYCYCGSLIL